MEGMRAVIAFRRAAVCENPRQWLAAERTAVEAFADAVCNAEEWSECRDRIDPEDYKDFLEAIDREHAACRARLLARVMEQADGR